MTLFSASISSTKAGSQGPLIMERINVIYHMVFNTSHQFCAQWGHTVIFLFEEQTHIIVRKENVNSGTVLQSSSAKYHNCFNY